MSLFTRINHSFLVSEMDRFKYKIFTKPRSLNIVAVRSLPSDTPNRFDDVLTAFWTESNGSVVFRKWAATTDPGLAWLKDPNGHPNGTAQVVPGQHSGSHRIGMHRNQYEALVQNAPIPVYRDRDRNNTLNPDRQKVWLDAAGINIHHAGQNSVSVDRWSAGCIVVAKLADWQQFQWMYRESAKLYGPVFSLTVLEVNGAA